MPGQRKFTQDRFDKNTFKRLFKYFRKYKFRIFIVILCIIVSSIVQVIGQLCLKTLIDDEITPLIGVANPVYTSLIRFIMIMAGIYITGVAATFLYNRIMISVAQGVLKNVRDEMFNHMQTLPISYFDRNTHGDIMSRYTNDTDTLEQMISQRKLYQEELLI